MGENPGHIKLYFEKYLISVLAGLSVGFLMSGTIHWSWPIRIVTALGVAVIAFAVAYFVSRPQKERGVNRDRRIKWFQAFRFGVLIVVVALAWNTVTAFVQFHRTRVQLTQARQMVDDKPLEFLPSDITLTYLASLYASPRTGMEGTGRLRRTWAKESESRETSMTYRMWTYSTVTTTW